MSLTLDNKFKEWKYLAPGLTEVYSLGTVSRLWLKTSGFASITFSNAPSFRRKSGVKISMDVFGDKLLISLIVFTKCSAPPSSRSSLSTEVITTWFKFNLATD